MGLNLALRYEMYEIKIPQKVFFKILKFEKKKNFEIKMPQNFFPSRMWN